METEKELLDFIYNSQTPQFIVDNAAEKLRAAGYEELNEKEKWEKIPEKFFVIRNNSNIIAINQISTTKGKIVLSHTDFPVFKIGKNLSTAAHCYKADSMPIGNGLWYSWTDRDLRIAGTVTIKSESETKTVKIASKEPVAVIPNLAIHLSSGSGTKPKYTMPNHFSPIFGIQGKDKENHRLTQILLDLTGAKAAEDIVSYDLYLLDEDKPGIVGIDNEFICSQGIDGQGTSFITLDAFLKAKDPEEGLNAFVLLDNTKYDNNFIKDILKRIGAKDSFFRQSSLFAVNGMPSSNPNGGVGSQVSLGTGIMYTWSAGMKYATNPATLAKVVAKAKDHSVALSAYSTSDNPPDNNMPTLTASLGISSVELGLPIIGLKSIREMCHYKDIGTMRDFVTIILNEM